MLTLIAAALLEQRRVAQVRVDLFRQRFRGRALGEAPLLLVGVVEQRRLVSVRGDLVALALALGVLRGFAAQQLGSLGDRGGGLVGGVDLLVLDLAVEREPALAARDRAVRDAARS